MIYPATYDITILQNATWKAALRATEQRQELESITISGGSPLFSAYCHKLEDGDKVVFTTASVESSGFISLAPSPETKVPCGLELNSIYYVIASGLTNDNFYVAESSGGTAIQAEDDAIGTFYVAKPVNLSGYTVDADVHGLLDDGEVATFVCSITDAANGLVNISMAPAVSSGIETGRYGYDVSFTDGDGERYYWLKGTATVERTYSRN
jgi:hypothetical protein